MTEHIVHQAPQPGLIMLPCCGKSTFAVNRGDVVSPDPSKVTCGKKPR